MAGCLLLKPYGYSADFFVHVDNLVGRFNLLYKIFHVLVVGADDDSVFFFEYDNRFHHTFVPRVLAVERFSIDMDRFKLFCLFIVCFLFQYQGWLC